MSGRIEEIKPGKWRITVELGRDGKGIRRRRRVTFEGTTRAAEKERVRLQAEADAGKLAPKGLRTVGEFLTAWLETHTSKLQPKTAQEYAKILERHLIPNLGRIRLEKLSPLQVQAYYSDRQQRGRLDGKGGLSAQSVLHHHRLLSLALSYAVRWGEIPRNPCDLVDAPSPTAVEMQVIDEAGILLLLDACRGSWLFLPVLLSVSTSLRRGEVLALRWSDLDCKTGLIHCRQSLESTVGSKRLKQPKTKRSRRPVELPAFAVEELALARRERACWVETIGPAWLGGLFETSLICCREDGLPWHPDSLSSRFRKAADSVGLSLRFHDLRHTHISSLLAAGEPVTVVSERAGHSTPRLTLEVYGHVLPGQGQAASDRFDERMRRAREKGKG